MPFPQALFLAVLFMPSLALAQEDHTEASSGDSTSSEALSEATPALTEASAVAFLQECLKKVIAKDDSLWVQTADGGLFPEGYWPFALKHLGEPGASLWTMGFQELDGWLSPENIDALPEKVEVVKTLHTLALRDLRPFPLEDFLDESKRPDPMPTVEVNTLSLGIDFDADGSISRGETAHIHELEGAFYWDPFGW